MTTTTPAPVPFGARIGARTLRAVFPLMSGIPKELQTLPGHDIDAIPLTIPTRHGEVSCLLYVPPMRHDTPAVFVNFHGGAFIVRTPEQDAHICRAIAADAGRVVISVDYDTAPDVRFPVAEHEAYDVTRWVQEQAAARGWDPDRVAVGGFSAGAKLAINVCQQARAEGTPMPRALVIGYPALDMTLGLNDRHSTVKHPAVAPWLISLMYRTYFPDVAERSTPLASPAQDHDLKGFPPTLLLTGADDSLQEEESSFAQALRADEVFLTEHVYPGADHGFTHNKPATTAEDAITRIVSYLSPNGN